MVWDDTFQADAAGHDEPIELVGTHLRMTGVINVGRFARLTDLINASSGYVRVRDARLLRLLDRRFALRRREAHSARSR